MARDSCLVGVCLGILSFAFSAKFNVTLGARVVVPLRNEEKPLFYATPGSARKNNYNIAVLSKELRDFIDDGSLDATRMMSTGGEKLDDVNVEN